MAGMIFTAGKGDMASLKLLQGKTLESSIIWGGSTPINVTGFSARLTVRADYNSTAAIADFTVANGRVTVGTTDGKFSFSMSATDSSALPAPFTGVYEIEVTDAAGKVYRAVYGAATIEPEVVKA